MVGICHCQAQWPKTACDQSDEYFAVFSVRKSSKIFLYSFLTFQMISQSNKENAWLQSNVVKNTSTYTY